MSSLYYDENRDNQLVLVLNGEEYIVNTYFLTRALERLLDDQDEDVLSLFSSSNYSWETMLKTDRDAFSKIEEITLEEALNNDLEYDKTYSHETVSYDSYYSINMNAARFDTIHFSSVTFNECNFSYSTFVDTTFENVVFSECDFARVSFKGVDLKGARFIRCSNLNLSGAINPPTRKQWLDDHFEKVSNGYIVYKTFNYMYSPNPNWKIEEGSFIVEAVNYDDSETCSYGINVGTRGWICSNVGYDKTVWKALLSFEDLADIVIPSSTDGKIRVARLQLLTKIDRTSL